MGKIEDKRRLLLNYSEMQESEIDFISELIKTHSPKKILEIGIAAGSCSAFMLEDTRMDPDVKLFGIDYNDAYYRDPEQKTGWILEKTQPDLRDKIAVYTGGVAAKFLDIIGPGIDFCVIDTMHVVPGELLDFLMVLPYLKDGAICILHDTNLQNLPIEKGAIVIKESVDQNNVHYVENAYATGLLMSVLSCDKIFPKKYLENYGLPNIVAFKITPSLRANIQNVFLALSLPWRYKISNDDKDVINKHIKKYYSAENADYFCKITDIMHKKIDINKALDINRESAADSLIAENLESQSNLKKTIETLKIEKDELLELNMQLQYKCERLKNEISFMLTSKFWKLRDINYKIKFVVFHPISFAKKYLKKIFNNLINEYKETKHYINLSNGLVDRDIYTLSLVVTFHAEGLIAKKTIQNIRDMKKYHDKFQLWKNIEFIAVLDKPDSKTEQIVKNSIDIFNKIEVVDFGNPADSRNFGVNIAKNNFILFADGDDLSSSNCFAALFDTTFNHYGNVVKKQDDLEKLPENEHLVAFPELLVEFPRISFHVYNNSNDNIKINNLFTHCYTSKIMCFRGMLLKYENRKNDHIYGHEDWDLNNFLLNMGLPYVGSKFVFYYRKQKDSHSVLNGNLVKKRLVDNGFFYKKPMLANKKFAIGNDNIIENYHENNIGVYKKFLKGYGEKNISIFDRRFHNPRYLGLEISDQVKIYIKLLKFLENRDFIFFAPWVVLGGADKLVVEYSNSLHETSYNPCLITTIKSGERIDQISIPHFDIASECPCWSNFSADEQMHILMKAIMNSKIKVIHVINSDIALQLIKYYKDIFTEYGVRIVSSLFCPVYNWDTGKYDGYPVLYPEIMRNSDLVLSDNAYWYTYFKELAGVDFPYIKLFSPIDQALNIKKKFSVNKKILWASRICNQKLMDVFYGICKERKNITFVVYGACFGDKVADEYFEKILKLKNVEYRGVYNDYSELNMEEFDLLLFTSKFEGIALVILDMIGHNLPIISSAIGDTEEIFGRDYGLLVKNVETVDEYCEKIDKFYNNPSYYFDKIALIRERIIFQHNLKNFQESYRKEINQFF
ncbi:MAG: glycosyltransferase [Candidatus Moranbacteria bacterium]|nr:glycosyltransferase [Candidatus Moranbacteria bacterium]